MGPCHKNVIIMNFLGGGIKNEDKRKTTEWPNSNNFQDYLFLRHVKKSAHSYFLWSFPLVHIRFTPSEAL